MKNISLVSFIIFGCLFSLPTLAADYYVDGTVGSDSTGTGTATLPYQTITQALTAAAGGDTVFCQGTVTDNIVLTAANSGTASSPTLINSWPGTTCILNAQGADYAIDIGDNVQYLVINNLSITNAVKSAIYSANSSANIIISDNHIDGLTGGEYATAINLQSSADAQIIGNTLNGELSNSYGINLDSSTGVLVANNTVFNFTKNGVVFNTTMTDSDIKNNLVYNIGGVDYPYSAGITIADSNNIRVINNTLFNTYDDASETAGIAMMTSSDIVYDITIYNNIISQANYALKFDDYYSGTMLDFNDYYNVNKIAYSNGVDYYTLASWQAATIGDQYSITTDPQFVSTTAGSADLHLLDTSPCIDTGTLFSSNTTDYDTETRPYYLMDIGADERPLITEAPTALTAITKTQQATSHWTYGEIYPVTSYRLILDTKKDFSNATQTDYNETSAQLTGLKAAQVYYYVVQSAYETTFGIYYSPLSTKLKFMTKPAKVQNLKTSSTELSSINLSWKKQARVTGYNIKLLSRTGTLIKQYKIKRNFNKKTISDLTAGTTYQVKVQSYKKSGDIIEKGKWSKAINITL